MQRNHALSDKKTNLGFGAVVLLGFHLIAGSYAVPLSMVMNSPGILIPNALDEELRDNNLDDDFTTHPLERLSSAATCLVAGVEYTHGQQIYRKDQCEFCLCLDGEMFCWWQDCPPTLEGPCKERGPFTPCQNGAKPAPPPPSSPSGMRNPAAALAPTGKSSPPQDASAASTSTDVVIVTQNIAESGSDDPLVGASETADGGEGSTDATSTDGGDEHDLHDPERTSTDAPKICTVMGRQYIVGERLPHTTGNCVECICGRGAQITCSPHQCASGDDDVDEINDYRPPGLRAAQPDVF